MTQKLIYGRKPMILKFCSCIKYSRIELFPKLIISLRNEQNVQTLNLNMTRKVDIWTKFFTSGDFFKENVWTFLMIWVVYFIKRLQHPSKSFQFVLFVCHKSYHAQHDSTNTLPQPTVLANIFNSKYMYNKCILYTCRGHASRVCSSCTTLRVVWNANPTPPNQPPKPKPPKPNPKPPKQNNHQPHCSSPAVLQTWGS